LRNQVSGSLLHKLLHHPVQDLGTAFGVRAAKRRVQNQADLLLHSQFGVLLFKEKKKSVAKEPRLSPEAREFGELFVVVVDRQSVLTRTAPKQPPECVRKTESNLSRTQLAVLNQIPDKWPTRRRCRQGALQEFRCLPDQKLVHRKLQRNRRLVVIRNANKTRTMSGSNRFKKGFRAQLLAELIHKALLLQ
jgi:hypothetical protein